MKMGGEILRAGLDSGTFDNFSLDCFRSCPMFYNLRIEKGLIRPGAVMTAANFGAALHYGLEDYYRGGMDAESQAKGVSHFIEDFSPHQNPADDKRTLAKGISLLQKYWQRYPIEPFNVIDVEVGGVVELPPSHYLYSFRIDLTLEWQSPKGVYGMDHKSSSSLYRLISKPHNQVAGYNYVLAQYYQNVSGFIVNGIGVYKTDKQKDKGTGMMVDRELFVRQFTTRTKQELEDWKARVLHTIKQIEECRKDGVWPMYAPSYCTAYSGRCMFLDICQGQDLKMLPQMIDAGLYEENWWVPYKEEMGEGEGGEG